MVDRIKIRVSDVLQEYLSQKMRMGTPASLLSAFSEDISLAFGAREPCRGSFLRNPPLLISLARPAGGKPDAQDAMLRRDVVTTRQGAVWPW